MQDVGAVTTEPQRDYHKNFLQSLVGGRVGWDVDSVVRCELSVGLRTTELLSVGVWTLSILRSVNHSLVAPV